MTDASQILGPGTGGVKGTPRTDGALIGGGGVQDACVSGDPALGIGTHVPDVTLNPKGPPPPTPVGARIVGDMVSGMPRNDQRPQPCPAPIEKVADTKTERPAGGRQV
ncbi:MAG: hypothetical protein DMD60_05125 [Gemmatimonadetes bacterium]|nr:MAG: hypothetical protein DMD60_05125 [Gemmatimonadota bacterium]